MQSLQSPHQQFTNKIRLTLRGPSAGISGNLFQIYSSVVVEAVVVAVLCSVVNGGALAPPRHVNSGFAVLALCSLPETLSEPTNPPPPSRKFSFWLLLYQRKTTSVQGHQCPTCIWSISGPRNCCIDVLFHSAQGDVLTLGEPVEPGLIL